MADPSVPLHHDALPAGTRLGEFEILDVVGVGGFGIVYRAHDHALERTVALKEYLPGALAGRGQDGLVSIRASMHAETFGVGLRSFVNEARLLAQFDHLALLKVYRFWEDHGTAYMVMPFYEGRTVYAMRKAMAGPPSEAWMRSMLEPLLGALEVMHQAQVFHRDIAPDNIILRPDGSPVLLDFGAARRVISDRTQALTSILKPNYAPIEQYAESAQFKQGPWTDLYALGAVVYFCATGRPPAPASVRVLHDELIPLPQLVRQGELPWSGAMARAWQAALSIRPAHRPQSVAGLRLLLESAVADTDLLPTVIASAPPQAAPTVARTQRTSEAGPSPTKLHRPPSSGQPGSAPRTGAAGPRRAWVWAVLAVPMLVAAAVWWIPKGRRVEPEPGVVPPTAAVAASAPASDPMVSMMPAPSVDEVASSVASAVAVAPAASEEIVSESASQSASSTPELSPQPPVRRPSVRHPPNGGALLPRTVTSVPVAPVAVASSAVAVPVESPRQACGSRVFLALYRCMQRQCEKSALATHPECIEWHHIEEGGRPRR